MAVNLNSNLSAKPAINIAFKADDAESKDLSNQFGITRQAKAETNSPSLATQTQVSMDKPSLASQPAKDDFTAPVKMNSDKEVKPNVGPVQGFKNFIAGCKKLFNNIAEYSNATLGGLLGGAVLGLGSFGTIHAINYVKKANTAMKLTTEAKPLIGKNGMIAISAILGLGTLAKSIFDASLNVSQKNANVEDRWMGRKNSVRDKI